MGNTNNFLFFSFSFLKGKHYFLPSLVFVVIMTKKYKGLVLSDLAVHFIIVFILIHSLM
ncbi:hypothetical protein CLU79DRAFT_762205, partial [Phycomyces nitens]